MSSQNMVDHARVELEKANVEPADVDWYLNVIAAFASYGHSGGSAAGTIPVIMKLLERGILTPLTSDPAEWIHYEPGDERLGPVRRKYGLWQSQRLTEAFSHDGGKTYYLLSEGGSDANPYPRHKSVDHKKAVKA